MYNKVILIGTITNPVVTKQINPNLQMGTLQLTTERTYPKQGVPFTETTIIDCDLWGKQIEEANKFDLGSTIIIEGRLRCTRKPNLKSGGEIAFLAVTVERIQGLNEQDIVEQATNNQGLDRFKQTTVDLPGDLPF
jgi:single-stranded DNA-binding protein